MTHADAPHVVYRVYTQSQHLLYVGHTHNLTQRLRQHQADRAVWRPYAAVITVENFPNKLAALEGEKAAIRAEQPMFNRQATGRQLVSLTGIAVFAHEPLAALYAMPARVTSTA